MNENQIGHYVLAVAAVIGIVVLQALGKGQPDLYALLGGLAGFSGQTATLHNFIGERVKKVVSDDKEADK